MVFPYIDKEPIIFLGLLTQTKVWLQVPAYVDSGASISVFGADIAEYLKINISTGIPEYLIIGNGSKMKVYVHRVNVKFADSEFEAKMAFSDELGIGTNLLGQRSFFDNFTFCFQTWNHRLEVISKYEKWH